MQTRVNKVKTDFLKSKTPKDNAFYLDLKDIKQKPTSKSKTNLIKDEQPLLILIKQKAKVAL